MRPNKIKAMLAEGKVVYNAWLSIGNSFVAEVMAGQGFDAVTIDTQHGPIGTETALTMLQAISTTDATPMARVQWNDPGMIMQLLDCGAYGLICPMINSRAEAEQLVSACRYAPQGTRSSGPTRVRFYAGADYMQHANHEIMPFAMIETAQALNNLDDILQTPGLDAIYVGPADLYLSLYGKPGPDFTNGEYLNTLARIAQAANTRGVYPSMHTVNLPEMAIKMREMGFKFITVSVDYQLLVRGAQDILKAVRGAV